MNTKKYELMDEIRTVFGHTLHRIRALKNFKNIKIGDLGGWIESESNLTQTGDARVFGNAQVYDNAQVFGNAQVYGNARVFGDAQVYGIYGILTFSNIGREQRTTTAYVCANGCVHVNCGCFYGTLAEFREKIHETHAGTHHEVAYMAAADFIEKALNVKKEVEKND